MTKENLMDMEFETQKKDEDGKTVTEMHKLSEFKMGRIRVFPVAASATLRSMPPTRS